MHVIDRLEFDVALHGEERAFEEQSRLQSFLRGPALRIIDEVFDAVSPPGEVLRLDRLEVDLGPVAGDDLPLLWERRLRECLLEQLQALRWRSRAEPGASVMCQPRRQADLETLTHYLGHGHLPWQGAAAAREGLATWAEAVVQEDGAAVARLLRQSTGRQDAVHRVAQQFSLPAVETVAMHLAGSQWPLARWVEEAVQRVLQAGEPGADEALRRRMWQTLLDALAAGNAAATDPGHLHTLLQTVARPAAEAPRTLRRVLDSLAATGKAAGDLAVHAASHAVEAAALDAASPVVVDTVSVAPAPAVLRRREFAVAWQQATQLSRTQARRQLHEHLLAWRLPDLPVARDGGLPDALDSLLRRAGQQLRIDPLALAYALQCALPHGLPPKRAVHPGQRSEQRSPPPMADRLDDEPAHGACAAPALASPGRPARADDLRQLHALLCAWRERAGLAQARSRVEAALARGEVPEADHDWPLLCVQDPDALRAALRRHGRDDARRARLAEHLPEPMVLDVIALLVPGEVAFLGGLLDQAPVFAAAAVLPVPALAPALRQFTLAYLLADRGSVFNRRSFLAHLVRQMAVRQGVDTSALLSAMSEALCERGAPSGLGGQLLRLLGELRSDDPAAVPAPMPKLLPMPMQEVPPPSAPVRDAVATTAPTLRQHLEQFLAAGDERGIDDLWQALDAAADDALASAVRALCRNAAGRRRMAQGLPAPLMLHLALRLQPTQTVFLRAFFGGGVGAGWLALAHPDNEGSNRLAAWSLWLARWTAARDRSVTWPPYFDAWLRHDARRAGMTAGVHLARLAEGLAGVATDGGPLVALRRRVLELLAQSSRPSLPPQVTPSTPPGSLAQHLHAAADGGPGAAAFEAALGNAARADHWASTGTDAELTATLDQLRPGVAARLQAEWAAIAGHMGVAPGSAARAALHRAAWRFALHHLFVEGRLFQPGDFARRFADWLRAKPGRLGMPVSAWLALEAAVPPPQPPPQRPNPPRAEIAEGTPVYVGNAGLVLLASYLPRLLTRVGLCDGRSFADPAAAQRAVHLVQWLADGRTHAEEHELTLNKLLCGLPLGTPLPREVDLSALELDTGLQMLQAVIAHWKALGQTSVEGLRTTFLQREGRLLRQGEAWRLLVEPRAFDMLLDRLPWGYATVRLPWMERVIHVDWR
ncbi:MAG: contractile injection system tape measure protein [Rubrivivax sp.]|nr:contractile injection system tape measure protein [Rubrivivax sp.]